jgi:EAL domain-containing protein (putative c-di-GMP-specific phosphodiesterase class I)
VKIDKSFVFAMAEGGGETLVRSIVDLGHNLDLRVVAEGVEDEVTLERLRELRCHAVQGHVLCRAVPAAVLEKWLASRPVGEAHQRVIVPLRKPARGT